MAGLEREPMLMLRLATGGSGNDHNHGLAGDITKVTAATIDLNGGGGARNYAQIGNGGYDADGNTLGGIEVTATNDVTLTSGSVADAYAQIGHGGANADGRLQGNIDVTASAGGIKLDSSTGGLRSYVQIGHGGYKSKGDKGAAAEHIIVKAADDVEFLSGGSDQAYAQIGHGGYDADSAISGNPGNGTGHAGDITVEAGTDGSGSVKMTGRERMLPPVMLMLICRSGMVDTMPEVIIVE